MSQETFILLQHSFYFILHVRTALLTNLTRIESRSRCLRQRSFRPKVNVETHRHTHETDCITRPLTRSVITTETSVLRGFMSRVFRIYYFYCLLLYVYVMRAFDMHSINGHLLLLT